MLLGDGLSSRAISKQLGIHRKTVESYRARISLTGNTLSELRCLDDAGLNRALSSKIREPGEDHRQADFKSRVGKFRTELHRPGVTRQLLWIEYLHEKPDGYSYSQFCDLLTTHLRPLDAVMHFEHQPGNVLQVDFAGDKMSYVDAQTGEVIECPVLVCVLPYSGFKYVEVLVNATQEHLFNALNHCLEYLGGVPRSVKFDNLSQVVAKPGRYEQAFTEISNDWAVHYQTNMMAARVAKPRDKPSVEREVNLSYMWVMAPLRDKVMHSVREVNQAVLTELDAFNRKPMSRAAYSRFDRFVAEEQPLLRQLPDVPFGYRHKTQGKVQRNYHVIVGEDWHQYSVPFQHIGKQVSVIYDQDVVEVYLDFVRIAAHVRSFKPRGYSTLLEHMPPHHRKQKEVQGWDSDYFLERAERIGGCAVEAIRAVMSSKTFIEQSYNSCLGIMRLADKVGHPRMEAACRRALQGRRVNFGTIKAILDKNLDSIDQGEDIQFSLPFHENLRGNKDYQ
jgi:transposase